MSEDCDDTVRLQMQYLASVLEGVRFPARRWQIITWATYNGAGLRLVGALQSMPEADYRSVGHVGRELHQVSPDWW